MSEPTAGGATSVAATAIPVSLAPLLPFVDTDLLIGAFAGGILFVVYAKNFAIIDRIALMIVSMLMGYFGGLEIHHIISSYFDVEKSTAISSFAVASGIVYVMIFLLERIRDGSFLGFLKRK